MKSRFKNIRVLIFTSACILLCTLTGENSYAQNLNGYLEMAADNNPSLKSKYAQFESSVHSVSVKSGMPDPTVSFGYFVSPIETRVGPQQAKLSVTQMFPWFGTLSAHEQRDTMLVKARYQDFMDARNKLYYEVSSAYYPLYEWDKKLAIQNKNIELLEGLHSLATSKYKNGLLSLVDVIRIEIMRDQAKVELEILETQYKPLVTHFNRLIGQADDEEIFLPDTLEVYETEIQNPDFNKNAQLLALDYQSQSAEMQVKASQKNGAPMLGVGLDYMFIGESENPSVENSGRDAIMPMVSLTLPIYRKKYDGAISEAKYNSSAIRSTKQALVDELNSSYQNELFIMLSSQKMVTLYNSQIAKTETAIKILSGSFQTSNDGLEDVLRMQELLLEIKNKQLESLTKYYKASARIDYLLGEEVIQ